MTNLITGIIGLATVLIFLGIMMWWIKALPLIIIVVVVAGFMIQDFIQSLRAGNDSGQH